MKTSGNGMKIKALILVGALGAAFAIPSCAGKNSSRTATEKPAVKSEAAPDSIQLPDFPIKVTKESAGCVHLDEIGGIQRPEGGEALLAAELSDEQIKKSLGSSENADLALINYMLYVNKKQGDDKSLWYISEGIKKLVGSTYASKGVFFGSSVDTPEGKKRAAVAAITLATYYMQTRDESVITLVENTLDVLSGHLQTQGNENFSYDIELHSLISRALLDGGGASKMGSYDPLGIEGIDRIRTLIQDKTEAQTPLNTETTILDAFIDAYEHTGVTTYLEDAEFSADRIIENYWSEDAGAFISIYDEEPYVCPEYNALAAQSLQKLYFLNDDEKLHERARKAAELFGGEWYGPESSIAYYLSSRHPLKVAVIGDKTNSVTDQLRAAAVSFYEPDKAVMTVDPMEDKERLEKLPYRAREVPTMYACVEAACSMPVSDPAAVENHLKKFVQKYLYGDESGNGVKGLKLE